MWYWIRDPSPWMSFYRIKVTVLQSRGRAWPGLGLGPWQLWTPGRTGTLAHQPRCPSGHLTAALTHGHPHSLAGMGPCLEGYHLNAGE